MASTFYFAPLLAPHDQPNMFALLVLNEETKARIQAIRQALVLHDAVSTSIEFTGVFIRADEPIVQTDNNVIEDLIAWFGEHAVPISSGVMTVMPHGISASAVPVGQADNSPLVSEVIPYTYLEKIEAVVSLLPDAHMMASGTSLLQ